MNKGAETRATIITEALKVAGMAGLGGISIGPLATRVGLSKSGLFSHFGSKEALQMAVLQEVIDRFIAQVIHPAVQEEDAEARIRALFTGWIRWEDGKGFPGGCPLQAAFHELDDQPGPLRDYIVEQQIAWMDCIERMAQKAMDEGVFRPDLNRKQFAFEANAIGLGYNYMVRLLRDEDAERDAFAAVDRLIRDARPNPED